MCQLSLRAFYRITIKFRIKQVTFRITCSELITFNFKMLLSPSFVRIFFLRCRLISGTYDVRSLVTSLRLWLTSRVCPMAAALACAGAYVVKAAPVSCLRKRKPVRVAVWTTSVGGFVNYPGAAVFGISIVNNRITAALVIPQSTAI